MNFLFAIKLTSIIYKVQISVNFKKIILKFLILYVALALNGNQFVLCKGNNSNNKMLKVYNFRIKSGIGNGILLHEKTQLCQGIIKQEFPGYVY